MASLNGAWSAINDPEYASFRRRPMVAMSTPPPKTSSSLGRLMTRYCWGGWIRHGHTSPASHE